MNRTLKLTLIRTAIVAAGAVVPLQQATALELVVTGNGASSQQTVVVEHESDTSVSQHNDTDAAIEIVSTQNTGANTISGTTGSVAVIQTGDIAEDVVVATVANTNTAVVDGCCADTSAVTVSQNGEGSTNDVELYSSSTLDIATHQSATIKQTHASKGNTGSNGIEDMTGGSATINSGTINTDHALSADINHSSVSAQAPTNGATTITISGNGSDSVTVVNYSSNKVFDILVQHSETLVQSILADYTTGDNFINGLTGGMATIITGDISSVISNTTAGSTSQVALVDVACSTDIPDDPGDAYVTPPQTTVTSPTASVGTNGSDSAASEAVGGAILGMSESLLPSTGADSLYAFLIANILMLVFGCYLRLRSGRSPAASMAIV